MKKFTIISKKGVTTIQEVEIQMLSAREDPSVMWMNPGEYKAKVLKPESVYEKQNDGSLTPPVWCWFAFFDSEEAARSQAESDLKHEFERDARKARVEFNDAAFLERCKEIKSVAL